MNESEDLKGELGIGARVTLAFLGMIAGLIALGVPWNASSEARSGGVGIEGDPVGVSVTNCCKKFNGTPTPKGFCYLDASPDAGITEAGEYLLATRDGACTFALAPESRFDISSDGERP